MRILKDQQEWLNFGKRINFHNKKVNPENKESSAEPLKSNKAFYEERYGITYNEERIYNASNIEEKFAMDESEDLYAEFCKNRGYKGFLSDQALEVYEENFRPAH